MDPDVVVGLGGVRSSVNPTRTSGSTFDGIVPAPAGTMAVEPPTNANGNQIPPIDLAGLESGGCCFVKLRARFVQLRFTPCGRAWIDGGTMLHLILSGARIRPLCDSSSFAGARARNSWATTLVATAALVLAWGPANAFAGSIVYEGFDYPVNTGLNSSANTGTGWTSNWTNDSWRTNSGSSGEISTGLTYSGLTTVGNAARNAGGEDKRSFAEQSASGTYWVSFLVQVDSVGYRDFGISLFDGGSEKVFMGQTTGASGNLSLWGNPRYDSRADSAAAPVANTPMLFVAEFDMVSGKAWFWIDPSLPQNSPSYASAVNGAGGSAFTPFAFDSVRMYGSGGYFDEIRIGTTAQDVGFASAIPEPSTWAGFAGLIALGWVVLYRRRSFRRSSTASA